jgi:predicted Zn-dependent protease
MTSRFGFVLVLGGALMGSFALAQDSPPPSPPTEKQIALGRAMAADLETQAAPLDDVVAVEFVEGMARRLADASGTRTFLVVRLLDSPVSAAHALPGGFLLVRSGLLAAVETSAEFAGMLAHQIAHIAAGHGARAGLVPPAGPQGRQLPAVYLGGWMGSCIRASGAAGSVPLGLVKQAASWEQEADSLALEYLDKAGYDPVGLVDAFDRLPPEEIPQNARMTTAIRDKARQASSSGRSYLANSSGFIEIRERLLQTFRDRQAEDSPSLRRPDAP